MNFKRLLKKAEKGDRKTMEELFCLYEPLLTRNAYIDGRFDEDLFQELCCTFLVCLHKFRMDG